MKPNHTLQRREFLAGSGLLLTGIILGQGEKAPAGAAVMKSVPEGAKYGYLIDTRKCIGCGRCMRACREENNVPAHFHRTWVERYLSVKTDKGPQWRIDAPGETGYPPVDVKTVNKGYFVPKLCNHCENPSCVKVCPTNSTYISPEGVVLVDDSWCIGCGYCVQACPYGMRFIHEEKGVAAKCTWCYHRITKDLKPACVLVCPTGARRFGDLTKKDDPVRVAFETERVYVTRPETGNDPQVKYTHLGREVV